MDCSQPTSIIAEKFPLFANAIGTDFFVDAGEMLYLPTGWFHEVTSYSSNPCADKLALHMAFNYWFHPPTMLQEADVLEPYEDQFWESDFLMRLNDEEKAAEAMIFSEDDCELDRDDYSEEEEGASNVEEVADFGSDDDEYDILTEVGEEKELEEMKPCSPKKKSKTV